MATAVALHNPPAQRQCSYLAPDNNPVWSAFGYGMLGLFLSIPFGAGAFFGMTSWTCDRALNWIYTKADISQNNTIANIVKFALRFFVQAGIGLLVLSVLGYPMTLGAAALFNVTAYLMPPCLMNALVYPFRTLVNVIGVDIE